MLRQLGTESSTRQRRLNMIMSAEKHLQQAGDKATRAFLRYMQNVVSPENLFEARVGDTVILRELNHTEIHEKWDELLRENLKSAIRAVWTVGYFDTSDLALSKATREASEESVEYILEQLTKDDAPFDLAAEVIDRVTDLIEFEQEFAATGEQIARVLRNELEWQPSETYLRERELELRKRAESFSAKHLKMIARTTTFSLFAEDVVREALGRDDIGMAWWNRNGDLQIVLRDGRMETIRPRDAGYVRPTGEFVEEYLSPTRITRSGGSGRIDKKDVKASPKSKRATAEIKKIRQRGKLEVVSAWQASSGRLARSVGTLTYNEGALRAAYDEGMDFKMWLATPDEITRDTHVEATGQCVPLDGKFGVGSDLLNEPGDPTGSPGEVYNCRCTMVFTSNCGDGYEIFQDEFDAVNKVAQERDFMDLGEWEWPHETEMTASGIVGNTIARLTTF